MPQQYLPDELVDRTYYRPSRHGAEAAWADMEERLGQFNTPGGWVGPNELLLTAAQR